MFKVGDSVIKSGYLGTVTAVGEHGAVCVRTAGGEGETDASDLLPGNLWPELVKMGMSDVRKARKEGAILVTETRRGLIELSYDAATKRYEGRTQDGHGFCVVNAATQKQAAEQMASLYNVQVQS